jgi:hypothetical protein
MKEDLKNVIMTFGLIALVFTQGSLAYQKKINREYILAQKQEELQKINENKILAERQNILIAEAKRKEDLIKQQIIKEQAIIKNAQNNTNTQTSVSSQVQLDLARNQALLLAQQQAAAQILAKQQAEALALQKAQILAQQQAAAKKIVTPARQSRAS